MAAKDDRSSRGAGPADESLQGVSALARDLEARPPAPAAAAVPNDALASVSAAAEGRSLLLGQFAVGPAADPTGVVAEARAAAEALASFAAGADGRSLLLDQFTAGKGTPDTSSIAAQARAAAEALASFAAGADGRSLLLDQFTGSPTGAASASASIAERARAAAAVLSSLASGADGRSLLLDQFVREPGRSASTQDLVRTQLARVVPEVLASALGAADGRSALNDRFAAVISAPDAETARARAEALVATLQAMVGDSESRARLVDELVTRQTGMTPPSSGGSGAPAPQSVMGPADGRSAVLQQLGTPDQASFRMQGRELAPGDTIGRFELVRELGRGGFGVVFEARDRELGRSVALKAMRPGRSNPQLAAMLLQEAEAAAKLQHENIVALYDYGQGPTGPYLVLELLRGETLQARLARGSMEPHEAVRIGAAMARGVAHAHEAGLLHRDIKPANVFLTEGGGVKVMDLGLAHLMGQSTQLSGTPAYMAPEQWRGHPQDARTDVFAMGVTLFEMLAGHRPYEVKDGKSNVLDEHWTPILDVPRAGLRLNSLVEKAIAKDPAARPASAQEVAAVLTRMERSHETRKIRWVATTIVSAMTIAGIIATVVHFMPEKPPPKNQTVLVADFTNGTGDIALDGTLEPVVTTALEGATFLTAYNRGSARKLADKIGAAGSGLSEERARIVAQRESVAVVTSGAIDRMGSRYRVTIRATDPFTGDTLLEESEYVASKERMLEAATKLAGRVRTFLGDATPESVQLRESVTITSASLDAAHEYALAVNLSQAGNYQEAKQHFMEAVRIDPNLGRAWSGLGTLERNRGHRAEAEEYLKKAASLVDRMTDREKYRTLGLYYINARDADHAIEAFSTLIKQYPGDHAGASNLALSYAMKHDFAKSLEMLKRVAAAFPNSVVTRNNMGLASTFTGAYEEAIKVHQKVVADAPTYSEGYVSLALANLAGGHREAAIAVWEQLRARGDDGASWAADGLADLAAYEGRLSDATAVLEHGLEADQKRNDKDGAARKVSLLGEIQLASGQLVRARDSAERALAFSRADPVVFAAGNIHAAAGDGSRAAELAEELDARVAPDARMYAEIVRSTVALQRHDHVEAVARARAAVQRLDAWLARYALGLAYLEAGDYPSAIDELDRCEKRRGEATDAFQLTQPTYRLFPAARYYLARAQEGLNSPTAAATYQAFLSVKKSDEDPLVKDARRRLAAGR